ncbi:DUF6003 family protein [Streptacidiphilus sp. N1-3]|uniref:DUF6003 family protein n=1 Tax=Streptacidiphilus alkalitolerans TaxID=3342712 RepID=A0ABV6XCW2_9ACTN
MSDSALLVIVQPGQDAAPGVDARRLPELECWDTAAVHGWLDAFGAEDGEALVRVVPADEADLVPEAVPRLEVPVTEQEAEVIARAAATPAVAEAQAELAAFRRTLAERPAMIRRAEAAGLSPARIERYAAVPEPSAG